MRALASIFIITVLSCGPHSIDPQSIAPAADTAEYTLVVHGGAGTILRQHMSADLEKDIRSVLTGALERGDSLLAQGALALDVVEEVIRVLEDSPHFNAGRGAVFTADGINELDASIMDGRNLDAGAVGGVHRVKNPIRAARAVMEHSPHVLLTGAGADEFIEEQGLETVDPSYYRVEDRWDALQRVKRTEESMSDKHGTVGCVARDIYGNIAAGTSTGGMTNKKWNRLGDSPIIGAGTYADNASGGVSCTGHGEYYIRHAVAHDITRRIKYLGYSAQQAADTLIHRVLSPEAGSGGVIVIDAQGQIGMSMNTPGMYRGYVRDGIIKTLLYADER